MSHDAVKDQLLCAFLDEELSHQDVDKLLDLLECEETRARACRQVLAGSVLNRPQSKACIDISASVRRAIEMEGPLRPLQPSGRRRMPQRWQGLKRNLATSAARRRWQVPASGLALAASVALAAVIVVKPTSTGMPGETALVALADEVDTQPIQKQGSHMTAAVAQPQRSAVRNLPATGPILKGRAPAQLVAAGQSGQTNQPLARELVIASPQQNRPVQAQWSLVAEQPDTALQQLARQQRLQQQLNTYLINHARHGGGSALPGALAYARVTAQPAQRTGTE